MTENINMTFFIFLSINDSTLGKIIFQNTDIFNKKDDNIDNEDYHSSSFFSLTTSL